jgi:hypothetical protein
LAVAECAGAQVVARDRKAFSHLGKRYDTRTSALRPAGRMNPARPSARATGPRAKRPFPVKAPSALRRGPSLRDKSVWRRSHDGAHVCR